LESLLISVRNGEKASNIFCYYEGKKQTTLTGGSSAIT
jgi:hypothetical protein